MLTIRRSPFAVHYSPFAILIPGLVLMIIGHFGPWVDHKASTLTVTGFELAEFAKFFPQVQGGTVPITRELFYLPFVMAFILLGFLAGRSTARTVRVIVPLLTAVLLPGALLPYPVVNSVRQALATSAPFVLDPQYTGQLLLVITGTVLTLLAPLARWLPRRAWGVLVALLALAGAVPALWQFALLHPLVIALYDEPLRTGWGLSACVAGSVMILLSGILAAASPELAATQLPGS